MRCAERRVTDERVIRINQPGNGVDPRHLERMLLFQRREDPGQAPREHGLADARRTAEQDVVPAGRGKLERSPRPLLSPNVRQVEWRTPRLAISDSEVRRLELAAKVRNGICEMPDADRLDPGERRFPTGLVRTDEALDSRPPGALGYGNRTAHSPKTSIQRELTTRGVLLQARPWNLPRRREQG